MMNQNQNNIKFLGAAFAVSLLLTGCNVPISDSSDADTTSTLPGSAAQEDSLAAEEAVTSVSNLSIRTDAPYSIDPASLFTERDLRTDYTVDTEITLNGNSASANGEGVQIDGSTITINAEGVYRISGTLADGCIVVNAPDAKVQLVLDQASITHSTGSAVYVQEAKKVFLTLADGSENVITDGTSYADTAEDAPDAAIFSRDSLTINGTGALTVNGCCNEGITSKDDLVITGGTIHVEAVGDGIQGKDYVAIADGDLTIQAGGDGIQSTNSTDTGMGFVCICGGRFAIDAAGDGIQAETELVVLGGTFAVTSGGGTVNAPVHTDDFGMGGFGMRGGWAQNPTSTQAAYEPAATDETADDSAATSVKGIKAGTLLYIGGSAEIELNSADDALHSNGDLSIADGTLSIAAGSKGVHADATAEISGGSLEITASYEGIEAAHIHVSGGDVNITASNDGFNASDGSEQGAMGGAVDASLTISGGNIYVNADGDGLDSNGDLTVSGGSVYVDGPTNAGNGALDCNGTMTCSGGLLVAVGASGMAEYPGSSQETIVLTTAGTQAADTEVIVTDADGNEILTYTPSKTWNSFIISSPDLEAGKTYTFTLNGADAGSVTLEDTVSFLGEAGGRMMGGGRGQMGGNFQPGEMPEDFDPSHSGGEFSPDDLPEGFDPSQMQPPTNEDGSYSFPQGGRGSRSGEAEASRTQNPLDQALGGRELTQG